MRYSKQEKMNASEELREILKEYGGNIVYDITSIGKGNESRNMRLYVENKDHGLTEITDQVATLEGNPCNNRGMHVVGVGMNMVFEELYGLNCNMMKMDNVERTQDGAYNYVVDSNKFCSIKEYQAIRKESEEHKQKHELEK